MNTYGQISFEKGYFIDENGQKTDCLIKNLDWKNNPTEFLYKLTENEEAQVKTIKSIQEFGIYGASKYQRFTVNIDRSSQSTNSLTTDRNPIFTEEQLLLKVLVEGQASLFIYEGGSLRKFFYSTPSMETEQLVYKKYKTEENLVAKNNRYKQQLLNALKCPEITLGSIENIPYSRRDLVNIFVKYNECTNSEFTNFELKQQRDLFNLTLRPGVTISSVL